MYARARILKESSNVSSEYRMDCLSSLVMSSCFGMVKELFMNFRYAS